MEYKFTYMGEDFIEDEENYHKILFKVRQISRKKEYLEAEKIQVEELISSGNLKVSSVG